MNVSHERTEEMLEEPCMVLEGGALLPTLCAMALLAASLTGQVHAPTALRHLMLILTHIGASTWQAAYGGVRRRLSLVCMHSAAAPLP